MSKIPINDTVSIDLPTLLDTRLLIQSNSGGGKSWLIRRILEQSHGKVQQIILDIEGEFSTLREKYDYILAAKEGDTAAEPRSAALLAKRLLELNVSAIIDLYELSHQERKHFARLFLSAMVNAPKSLWHPCLVVIDEAHIFCPQAGQSEAMEAVIDLATRGRKRGYAAILATQRLSKLHKDAVAEMNNKLIGRTGLDIDRKRAAEELGFTTKEDALSLRNLAPGEFYAFGPAISESVEKITVGSVETSHPKAGARIITKVTPPTAKIRSIMAKLADLPQEAHQEAQNLETLKAENTSLKRHITQLEKQPRPVAAPQVTIAEVPVISDEQLGHLLQMGENLVQFGNDLLEAVKAHTPVHHYEPMKNEDIKTIPPKGHFKEIQQKVKEDTISDRAASFAAAIDYGRNDVSLSAAERKILTVLAQYPSGRTRRQLGILSGYSVKSGHFTNTLSKLRQAQYIEGMGDDLRITKSGIEAVGDFEPVPTGQRLVDYWLQRLGKAPSTILSAALEAYPNSLSYDDLAERTGYSKSSGHFTNTLSKLRGLQLVSGTGSVRAADVFFEEEARS